VSEDVDVDLVFDAGKGFLYTTACVDARKRYKFLQACCAMFVLRCGGLLCTSTYKATLRRPVSRFPGSGAHVTGIDHVQHTR
jgi:hypothetical protein